MRISCPSCQSSYKIADEKVQGRIVKVRCRKCGLTIHVNEQGVMTDATAANTPNAQDTQDAQSPSTQSVDTQASAQFSVLVADGDQRDMSLSEIVTAYNSGVVTAETYVWTEGQADWMPLATVASIVDALNSASEQVDKATSSPPTAIAPQASQVSQRDEATVHQATPPAQDELAAMASAASAEPQPGLLRTSDPQQPTGGFAAQAPAARTSQPRDAVALQRTSQPRDAVALQRTSQPHDAASLKRASQKDIRDDKPAAAQSLFGQPAASPAGPLFGMGAAVQKPHDVKPDLFGAASKVGSDDDVATSAPVMSPVLSTGTGARDESSVMFSLSALTSAAAATSGSSSLSKEDKDDSGLIDLRALAEQDSANAPAAAPIVSGGILDNAPLLGSAIVDPSLHQLSGIDDEQPKKKNTLLIAAIVMGAIGMVSMAITLIVVLTKEPPPPPLPPPTPVVQQTVEPTATAAATPADTSSAAAPPSTGTASASATAQAPIRRTTRPGTKTTGKTDTTKTSSGGDTAPASTKKTPPANKCNCPPGDLACNIRCSVKGK